MMGDLERLQFVGGWDLGAFLSKVSDISVSVCLVCLCMCVPVTTDLTHKPSQSCSWLSQWSGTFPSPAAPAMLHSLSFSSPSTAASLPPPILFFPLPSSTHKYRFCICVIFPLRVSRNIREEWDRGKWLHVYPSPSWYVSSCLALFDIVTVIWQNYVAKHNLPHRKMLSTWAVKSHSYLHARVAINNVLPLHFSFFFSFWQKPRITSQQGYTHSHTRAHCWTVEQFCLFTKIL